MTAQSAQSPQALVSKGRVPDFFIIGNMKSGTSALYDILRRHPQIHMTVNKEPWFFADELTAPDVIALRPSKQGHTPATLEEYMALFAGARADQRVGDASAIYLWSPSAAARIAEAQPKARLIAVLREPASFLCSLHLQFVQNYNESEKDFANAIALEDERRHGRKLPPGAYMPGATLYSDHVRYVEQLRRYENLFAPEQMLVLIYDDFRTDNEATARRVLRFLDVEDAVPTPQQINPTVRVRSPRLHALLHATGGGGGPVARTAQRAVRSLMSPQTAMAIRDRILFAEPRPPEPELMARLRRRFRGEVEALSEHLDRDLVSLWGYDKLD